MSNIPESEIDLASQFIEDLSKLLSTYSQLNFSKLKLLSNSTQSYQLSKDNYTTTPDKDALVGILPRILSDTTLFKTNDDIAQFAESVMKITIINHHKKSKYEIIGHVVCNTDKMDASETRNLVKALKFIINTNGKSKQAIRKMRQNNFGWNIIIQDLIKSAE